MATFSVICVWQLLFGVLLCPVYIVKRDIINRVVCGTKKRDHIKPVLRDLHWFLVPQRMEYKVALITHKVLSTGQPEYLRSLIKKYVPTQRLRSEGQRLLSKPSGITSVLASHSFTCASETVWNNLPDIVRKTDNVVSFKKKLKTHLFSCVNWT